MNTADPNTIATVAASVPPARAVATLRVLLDHIAKGGGGGGGGNAPTASGARAVIAALRSLEVRGGEWRWRVA